MARNIQTIIIDNILGGEARVVSAPAVNEFSASVNIDPTLYSGFSGNGVLGNLSIVGVENVFSSTTITQTPIIFITEPKKGDTYAYGINGSVYVVSSESGISTGALSDGGSMSGVTNACGAAYYDNYIYFAKDTTVARYGPLDGTPAFNGDYWVGTLGLPQLNSNTDYLPTVSSTDKYLNHVMHRHSDGKLYFTDVTNGQGIINYIATTKTTVEGDTNNGSTYQKLTFGYGLSPIAIESYGSDLAIGLFEGLDNTSGGTDSPRNQHARLAIWDTSSQTVNFITNNEYPDEIITAIKNVNGILYLVSGMRNGTGFRVSNYLGGYSFEDVFICTSGICPFPGAVVSNGKRIIIGSDYIYSIGLANSFIGNSGVFRFAHTGFTGSSSDYTTCLYLKGNLQNPEMTAGWKTSATSYLARGIDTFGESRSLNNVFPIWYSQLYRIGRPFKITKVSFPIDGSLLSSSTIIPFFYTDSAANIKVLATVNSSSYGVDRQLITIRPNNLTGDWNFIFGLQWTGSSPTIVGLPIIIEYELLDIDSSINT